MGEILWVKQPVELKRLVREWCAIQTGVVRAYKNGEISRQKYTALKKKLLKVLDWIEVQYV